MTTTTLVTTMTTTEVDNRTRSSRGRWGHIQMRVHALEVAGDAHWGCLPGGTTIEYRCGVGGGRSRRHEFLEHVIIGDLDNGWKWSDPHEDGPQVLVSWTEPAQEVENESLVCDQ